MVRIFIMLSTTMLHILIFTTCPLGQQDDTRHILYNLKEYGITTNTFLNLVRYKLQYNPSWFKMKLRIFHAIMFSAFIINATKESIKVLLVKWFRPIMFCILNPFLPLLNTQVYWGSMVLSSIGLLYVEVTTFTSYKPPTLSPAEYEHTGPINLMFVATSSPPTTKNLLCI